MMDVWKSLKEEWVVYEERENGNVVKEWIAFKNAMIQCASSACGMKRMSMSG